ncbi:hypothetical protein ATANTOWER_005714 [Ataeniobius toweri]|uniref:Uncharacterized protein n=1 Tax=Ataeniobius toweri TaxID=208326 RepID=A0ABU7C2C1_9TELE|nr:hypothetical protein [Ataeniobius toweri]
MFSSLHRSNKVKPLDLPLQNDNCVNTSRINCVSIHSVHWSKFGPVTDETGLQWAGQRENLEKCQNYNFSVADIRGISQKATKLTHPC